MTRNTETPPTDVHSLASVTTCPAHTVPHVGAGSFQKLAQRVEDLDKAAASLKGRKGYTVAIHRLQQAKHALLIASNAEARKREGKSHAIEGRSDCQPVGVNRGRQGILARMYRALAG